MRAAAVIVGILALTPADLAGDERPGDPAAGRQVAEQSCRRCHAIGREGGRSAAPALRTIAESEDASHQRLLAIFDNLGLLSRHPGATHPPVSNLDRQKMRDVIAYMQTLVVPEAN